MVEDSICINNHHQEVGIALHGAQYEQLSRSFINYFIISYRKNTSWSAFSVILSVIINNNRHPGQFSVCLRPSFHRLPVNGSSHAHSAGGHIIGHRSRLAQQSLPRC